MENNILDLLLFPEFILSVGAIAILLIGLFTTKNVFSFTSNLSVILLIIVGIIIYINKNISVAYFNIFFRIFFKNFDKLFTYYFSFFFWIRNIF